MKNKNHWKKQLAFSNLFQERGSAAILLALIVSTSVAATIFVSQNTMTQFISARSRTQEGWQVTLTAQYGLNLGGYLVSNNLILCREGGFSGIPSLCKWTFADQSKQPDHFKLSKNPQYITTTTSSPNRKVLQYNGTHEVEGKKHQYSINFDLVSWKNSNIQSLVGKIPESFCRNAKTLQIIPGNCNPKTKNLKCGTENKGRCEYISNMDQDYHIVLMTVTINHNNIKTVKHAAIRRPLAQVSIAVTDPARCELTCVSGDSLLYPECRGSIGLPNMAERGDSKMTIRVTNKGPGTIYALQLNRVDTRMDIDCSKKNAPSPCPPTTRVVTADLLQSSSKEALLPNEYLTFEDLVDCSQQNIYNIQTKVVQQRARRRGTTTTVSQTKAVDLHGQDFLEVKYSLFADQTLSSSPGVCMDLSDSSKPANQQLVQPANCPGNFIEGNKKTCAFGSKRGVCRYSHIEPRRIFSPDTAETSGVSKKFTSITNQTITIIQYIVPH